VESVEVFADTGRGDVRKLKGADDEYRLRVGEYRVRFRVEIQVSS
jgi:mRNA interferase RelE/StbE